jgi:hypothetical protein
MKTILTAMMLAFSLQSFAGEVVVYDAPSYETRGYSDVKKSFGINNALGRAWVSLTFIPSYNEDLLDSEARVLVPGLSYNVDTKEVVLAVAGEHIVCATVKKIFFGTTIRATGKCAFKTSYYKVQHDNGYETETIEKMKITMNF